MNSEVPYAAAVEASEGPDANQPGWFKHDDKLTSRAGSTVQFGWGESSDDFRRSY
jgi:hypothetical protein